MSSSARQARWKRALPGFDRAATIIVLTGLALLLVLAAAGSFRNRLLHFLPDDSFYYLEIARRVWLGQGSTFDGINPTNGYHPLWLMLLLPLAPLLNLSREAGARVVLALGVVLLGIALFVLRSVAARVLSGGAAGDRWVALLFPGSALTFAALYGLESPLAALFFALLLWTVARNENSLTGRNAVVIGLVSGALVLSRLDSASYVLALDLSWAWSLWAARPQARDAAGSEKTPHTWRSWFACLVAQTVVVAPYLAFNLWQFGHLLTISAVMKTARVTGLNLLWARSLLAILALAAIAMGLIATWINPRLRASMVWCMALWGSLVNLLLVVLWGGSESYSWYFTLPVLGGGLFASGLLTTLKTRGWSPRIVEAMALGCCLVVLTTSAAGRLSTPQFAARFDRARWIDTHTPPEAIFAAGNCGILGYFSRRSFIDLDGLSNSFAYEQAIRDNRVAEWLTTAGLNAAVFPQAEKLESAPEGTARRRVRVRGRMEREFCLVLKPWEPKTADDDYVLWRVVRIEGRCH